MSGRLVWFTGRPAAGKSTLARAVAARLRREGRPTVLLDGDEVRAALVPAPGYDDEGRDAFYATLAGLAALLVDQGLVVLVAATAHRRAYRERARARMPAMIEVFVDASAEETARRDPKHLYRDAARGAITGVPGADLAYEPPTEPQITARGGKDAAAIEAVVAAI